MAGKPGRSRGGTSRKAKAPGRSPRGAPTRKPPKGSKGGPPIVEFDLAQIKVLAGIGCTVDEIAAVMHIGKSTFYDRMAADPAVKAAIDEGREEGRATLRRNQWNAAKNGNPAMLIWLGKQLLGQKDRTEHSVDEGLEALLDRMIATPSPQPPGDVSGA